MGATNFAQFGFGKTAADAYRAACDEARRENGHQDGYSGDIQTTAGFRVVTLPKGASFATAIKRLRKIEDDLYIAADQWDTTPAKRLAAEKRLAKADEALVRAARLADNKFGPCVCIEVTGKEAKDRKAARYPVGGGRGVKVFYFFGTAAC